MARAAVDVDMVLFWEDEVDDEGNPGASLRWHSNRDILNCFDADFESIFLA